MTIIAQIGHSDVGTHRTLWWWISMASLTRFRITRDTHTPGCICAIFPERIDLEKKVSGITPWFQTGGKRKTRRDQLSPSASCSAKSWKKKSPRHTLPGQWNCLASCPPSHGRLYPLKLWANINSSFWCFLNGLSVPGVGKWSSYSRGPAQELFRFMKEALMDRFH